MNKKNLWLFFALALIILGLAMIFFWQQIKLFKTISIKPESKPLMNAQLVYIPTDDNDPYFGNPGAPLWIVEFADFGCKKCSQINAELMAFARTHPADVKIIWKNAPISGWISDGSEVAHRGAYCASKQNKFWEFTSMVFADRNNLKIDQLNKIAEGLKLNMTAWVNCVNSDTAKQKIAADLNLAQALGVNELPGIFVNNRQVNIPDDIVFSDMLNTFLKK